MTDEQQTISTPPAWRTRLAAAARGGGRAGRWLRRFVIGLAVLAVLAWIAVPLVVRYLGESQGSRLVGRPLRIGAVHFNPLTLRMRLEDVAIAGTAPGQPDAFAFRSLALALKWRTVWEGAPVASEAVLEAPVVRVARTGPGHFDVDDIISRMLERKTERGHALQWAVYNIRIENGRVEFDDRPVGRRHLVEQLTLGVPFVSTLPEDEEVRVQPRLAFVLDGARYDSLAQATPFHLDRTGTFELHTGDVALAPWLAYWPAALGWRPTQGRVRADATLAFSTPPKGAAHWSLAGELRVDDLALVDAAGAPLVGWRGLALRMREIQPFERKATFDRIAIDGLDLALDRDARGELNLVRAFRQAPAGAPSASAASPASGGTSASAASAAAVSAEAAPAPWRVAADTIDVSGRVAWRDASVAPVAAYAVEDLRVRIAHVRWPLPPGPVASAPAAAPAASAPASAMSASASALASAPAPTASAPPPAPKATQPSDGVRVQATARWVPAAPASASAAAPHGPAKAASAPAGPATLALEGSIGERASELEARIERLPLAPLRPYLSQRGAPATEGELSTRVRARWDGMPAAAPETVDVAQLEVDELRLHGAGRAAPATAWRHLQLENLHADLPRREITLERVKLGQPEVWLERDSGGTLNVARWWGGGAGAGDDAATRPAAPPAAAGDRPGWQVLIGGAAIADGKLHWRDAPAAGPVALDVDTLQLDADGLAWPAGGRAPARLKLKARVAPGDRSAGAGAGRLDFEGSLGLSPVAWQGRLRVERLPLHAADAYLAAASPVRLLHADVGWRGTVEGAATPQGLKLAAKGDALLTDLHARARYAADPAAAGGEDLLSWQSLAVRGTDLALTPGQVPRLGVGDIALAGAYARLVVTEEGHFNLTDLAPPAAASAPAGAASAATEPASAAAPLQAAAAGSAPAGAAPGGAAPPDIRIGGIHWSDTRLQYTDRLIRPNYSAELSELSGSLGAFSTRAPDLAPLVLKGRIEGTGVLDVQGELNPLAKPLALDIRARAHDIELAPLSPYAGKYAGYAIERGKLTMNVHYKVQPDGRLEATNQVVLNQLTFGDKVDSPSATKLPVLFAVALLKDRNGVIDVNLPIGGSINDPQFSVGGIIWKLILNLLERAITAPFSLLAGGGEHDLSQVLFVPGTPRLKEGSDETLDKVAKALQERPGVQLTITGLADADQEHADLQAANLEARLVGLRRTELLQAGEAAVPDVPEVSPEDRTRLVKRLYADTKLPGKPRNVLGLAKDLPQPEMETRLREGLPLPADAARALAVQRAAVVRDALVARGLPNERMFVASPKVHGAGSAEPGEWLPHVQLELSSR